MSFRLPLLLTLLLLTVAQAAPLSRDAVLTQTLVSYTGPTVHGVDTSTLTGKLMCGYQGWFNAEGDGAGRGWVHWNKRGGPIGPGNINVDLWPDVSELGPDERFATEFKHADGSVAELFSSFKKATVLRHFEWMRQYGIDGAFVQRFAGGLRDPRVLLQDNTVLASCREGANRSGRAYAVMYDLSGLGAGRIGEVIDDWKALHERMHITDDPAYLRHRGKPLVSVWGIGFSDHRAYTLAECRQLMEFLKSDGCSVMIGVPDQWRTLRGDAVSDEELLALARLADVVSPWEVGRFGDLQGVARHAEKTLAPDLAWCKEAGADYLPVVFPGFSWHNLKGGPSDQIPRRNGAFLWSQLAAVKRAGASMIYVAMFDEVDEGTAIFKCTNDVPPPGDSTFVSYGGLPSDFYLRLTGQGARMLRGEIPITDSPPK